MPSVERSLNPFIQDTLLYEGESEEERLQRERKEVRAKEVSDAIDDQLRQDLRRQRNRKEAKVLLLGRGESGKFTFIKNFQLMYAHSAWVQKSSLRKIIVYLNLIQSVTTILDAMNKAAEEQRQRQQQPLSSPSNDREPLGDIAQDLDSSEKHKSLRLRLEPLTRVRKDLEYLGSALKPDSVGTMLHIAFQASLSAEPPEPTCEPGSSASTGSAWKTNLSEIYGKFPEKEFTEDLHATAEVLYSRKADIKELWEDPVVQRILDEKKSTLAYPGLCVNDINRVLARDYQPSDQDALNTRLKNVGIQEYSIPHNNEWHQNLTLYDIGNLTTFRQTWCSYFDNVNSIVFLVPVGYFDGGLEEDPDVNHLEADLFLWEHICNCGLLRDVHFILFFTRISLLETKLQAGIHFNRCVTGYGSRPNNVDSVIAYLRQHFKTIHESSGNQSRVYCSYLASYLDPGADEIATIITALRGGILHNNLKILERL